MPRREKWFWTASTMFPKSGSSSPEQARLLDAVCARIVPQDDRDEAHKIPIVPWIDERLFADRHDGYRFEDMPPDGEAYRLGLRAIEEIARHLYGRSFCDIGVAEQDQILETLHDGASTSRARHLETNACPSILDAVGARLHHRLLFASLGVG